MTTHVNLFTHLPYPADMADLKYDKTLTFRSVDLPYFSIRSFHEKKQTNPMSGADFKDLFKPITDEGWGILTDVETKPANKREFDFLEKMGLGFYDGEQYYVSRFAYILYNKKHGLFPNYDNEDSIEQKKELLAPLMRLFLTYILPGRWWRAVYARDRLPDTIGESTMLNTEMLEIEDEWLAIDDMYGMPDPENNPVIVVE